MFDDLDLFLRLAEHANLNQAARYLRLPKSTVSRRLSALESRLGVLLFLRKASGLELTRDGRMFLGRCEGPMLALRSAVEASRTESGSIRGPLRVAIPRTFATFVCAPALETFSARHPDVVLELDLDDRPRNPVEGKWDVAIRIGPVPDGDLRARVLGELRGVIFTSPEYVLRRGLPTQDALHEHPAIVFRSPYFGPRWEMLDPSGRVRHFDMTTCLTTNDLAMVREAALLGMGVARAPRYLVAEDLRAGRLLEVLPGWTTAPRKVHALHPAGHRPPPRVRAFLDHIVLKLHQLDLDALLSRPELLPQPTAEDRLGPRRR